MTTGKFKHPEILNINQLPDTIIWEIQKRLPVGSHIFEYGTWKWRNAIPLAQAGYRVNVQDISSEYLDSIRKQNIKNITIEMPWDALNHFMNNTFDTILCIRVLHFMTKTNATTLIEKMQNHTNIWWFNAVNFFIDTTEHHPDFFFPSIEEMSHLYSWWNIIFESWIMISDISKSTSGRQMFQKSILFQKTPRAL